MKKYKLAVDLGTTTIELALIDHEDIILSTCFSNPQSLYGRDVINRILTATRDRKYLKIMKDMFSRSLADNLFKLIDNPNEHNYSHIELSSIEAMCICGNTTMISILLEYDLEELGFYPFKHKLNRSVKTDTIKLFGEDYPIKCPVILSGCVSAFIGGDVIAGLITLENNLDIDKPDSVLFLDLGTNGEMILYSNGTYYCTSTACGPAFEACARKANVYGSNLIDAISLGIKTGNISKSGALKDVYLEKGLDVLGVHITSDILREILLAKAAIYTGIECLFSEAKLDFTDIDRVYIAGGFGFHLNIDNSIYIGLIPEVFKGKISVVGNTSLKGAIMLLKSPGKVDLLDSFTEHNIRLIQMANMPDYQDKLINNMFFAVR